MKQYYMQKVCLLNNIWHMCAEIYTQPSDPWPIVKYIHYEGIVHPKQTLYKLNAQFIDKLII